MMSKNKVKKKFEAGVMKKIREGRVRMRPKSYFVVGSIFMGLGLVLLMVVSILTVQAIYVRLTVLAQMGDGRIGWRWPLVWLRFFPWGMLVLAGVMTWVGGWLLGKYESVYKRGLGLVLVVMMAVVIIMTGLMNRVGLGRQVRQKPLLRQFYMYQEHPWGFDEWKERDRLPGESGTGRMRGVSQIGQ